MSASDRRGWIERARRLYATPIGGRFIRYTLVSVFNVVFSVAVVSIVFGVFRIWTEVPSTLFANVVTIPPAYYLTRTWAWGKSGRSHLMREVVPFWVMTLAGIALSIATSSEARHLGIAHHLNRTDRTALLVMANLLAFGVTWIGKFLAERPVPGTVCQTGRIDLHRHFCHPMTRRLANRVLIGSRIFANGEVVLFDDRADAEPSEVWKVVMFPGPTSEDGPAFRLLLELA